MTTGNFCFFICKTDYSKPVKQEVSGTVILPPLVFPGTLHRIILICLYINVYNVYKYVCVCLCLCVCECIFIIENTVYCLGQHLAV